MNPIRIALATLLAIELTFSGGAMAIEEPSFEVIEKSGDIEIRQYRPFIVAETLVEGDMDAASGAGFRLIADYIFGNNQSRVASADKSSEKIAMTAPVTIQPATRSEKIAMTAPVTIASQGARWRVHFVMPGEYSLATLPIPRNPAVTLREVPGKRYAALVFSGLAGEEKVQEKARELQDWLKSRNLEFSATPQLARYNPPWTLPFLRRNEILIEISVL